MTRPPRELICISFSQLQDPQADISQVISDAYGPDGLGILAVSDVPGFPAARAKLLPLASKLAALPKEQLAALEDRESGFNFGWSHGKEMLEKGKPDLAKGSFYANPCYDRPYSDPELMKRYPTFCRPNIWPREALTELEPALKELGQLITSVGTLLASHCDRFVLRSRGGAAAGNATAAEPPATPAGGAAEPGPHPPAARGAARLERVFRETRCVKARLLHYFPLAEGEGPSVSASGADDDFSSWCGWHRDHGSLTGLTSAMFCDASGTEVPCPDPKAGLYVRARDGQVVHVRLPAGSMAFQMGDATQIHSGGALVATPHCVRAALGAAAVGVARNQFAVFIQPNYDEPMDIPPGKSAEEVGVEQWREGLDFGEFARVTVERFAYQ